MTGIVITQEEFDSVFKRPKKEKRNLWLGFMRESVHKNYLAKLSLVIPSKAKRIKFRRNRQRNALTNSANEDMIDAPEANRCCCKQPERRIQVLVC